MKKEINGHQYEYQCAEKLKKNGFSKVIVTKGSHDQGIDVIAHNKGKKYGIQCKYYSSPVGNHAVQEAFAGAKYHDCDIAVVMTNTTFTNSAKQLAAKIGVDLWPNNKIPFFSSSFKPTKYLGIFVCLIAIYKLFSMQSIDHTNLLMLQILEAAAMIGGAVFAIFEHRQWKMPFFSGIFYFLAGLLDFIFSTIIQKKNWFYFLFFFIIALLSFFRAIYLHSRQNRRKS